MWIKSTSPKRIALILISSAFIPLQHYSCSTEDFQVVDCSECYTDKPEFSEAKISVTIDDENLQVPITVYLGSYDDGLIVYEDITTIRLNYVWLKNEVDYTLVAEYTRNGRTVNVVNGLTMKIRKDYENCNEPCYYVRNRSVNLKLKR